MKKIKKTITIESDVDEETSDMRIEEYLRENLQNFCKFHFWKGNEAKITIL